MMPDAMRRLHVLLISSIAIGSWGCGATFPKTPEELRFRAEQRRDFTAPVSLKDAYKLVAVHTIRCLQGREAQTAMVTEAFFVFPTTDMRVAGRLNPETGTATVSTEAYRDGVSRGFAQVIDLTGLGATHTRVSAYHWKNSEPSNAVSVQDWFSGGRGCYGSPTDGRS